MPANGRWDLIRCLKGQGNRMKGREWINLALNTNMWLAFIHMIRKFWFAWIAKLLGSQEEFLPMDLVS